MIVKFDFDLMHFYISLFVPCSQRFGSSLRYIELPIEIINHTVFHELANKCPNLTHMLLDFSTAMQLHDFSEMQVEKILKPLAANFPLD